MILLLAACTQPTRIVETPDTACDAYPEDAVRPMEEGSVLYPYRWPEARGMSSSAFSGALDLGFAPCDTDPDIDWSPFDILYFVSIPAW